MDRKVTVVIPDSLTQYQWPARRHGKPGKIHLSRDRCTVLCGYPMPSGAPEAEPSDIGTYCMACLRFGFEIPDVEQAS